MANGTTVNNGVYHDPAGAPEKVKDFDLTATHKTDIVAKFSAITLNGSFYNATRIVKPQTNPGMMGPGGAPATPPPATGRNLILTFDKSKVNGVITASAAKHVKDPIAPEDYKMLGEVTNTPGAAINNGVNVNLTSSTWTVTGTSYLTSLTIGKGSAVAAPQGQKLTMTVNGKAKPIRAGIYKGEIVLQVAQ
jgi:hypothetical protein